MGVDGLWELLSPAGSHVPVEALSGRTYAIDASIWFHQFIQAMRDSEGMMMRNAHLIGFARRCCKLLFLNVKPVFVFDGTPHPLKYATLKQRRKEREKQEWKIRRTAEKLIIQQFLHNQKSSGEVPATSVTVKSHVADQQEPEPAPSSAKRRRSNPEDEVADDERVYKDQGIEALMEQRKSMRVQNREEAIVQAFAPEAFSRQQLAGFLKSAQLNRQISSARGMRCSGVGRTVKRIASDPAKEYVLEQDTTMNYKGVLSGNFPTLETVPHRKEPVPWGTEWAARAIHASDLITAEENSRGRKRGLPLQDSDAEDSLEWEVVGGADDEVPVARASDTIEDDPVLRGFEKAFEIVRMKNGELDLRDPPATEMNAEEPPKSFCRHPGPEIPQHTQSESRIIGDDHRTTDLEALKSCSDSNRQSDNISHKDYLSDASPLENQGQAYSLGLKHHLETDGTETVNGEALVPEALLVKEQRDIQMTEILPVISHTEDTPRLVNHDNSQSLEENVAIDRDLSKDFEDIEWTGSPGISHRILSPKLTDDSNHSSAPDIMSPIWNTDMNVSPEPFVPQFGSISEEMLEETKLLLDLFGIPYLEAPQEAEAQCAFLNLAGLVDGVITDDGDALLFGAQQVLRNVFRQSKYVEMYKLDHLERELGLDR
uniref:XPG N-terminal domain-containing protein n=1 Tax=Compsopogon caeruleus TaxID=31354 RepID=A0A7S1XGI8_9RHOD|mmetsp:Transcript_9405/g.19244  ORF Transcript_9405/g.19244 Transcript_9405/m.19244 type:complete len:656 (+) Transcript_9405:2130-4097(+)